MLVPPIKSKNGEAIVNNLIHLRIIPVIIREDRIEIRIIAGCIKKIISTADITASRLYRYPTVNISCNITTLKIINGITVIPTNVHKIVFISLLPI